jgi:hypothetical protein
MATFARDIARGDVGMPPPTGEDPLMDAVGGFFFTLHEIEQRVLSERYVGGGGQRERARRVGQSARHLRVTIDRLLERLTGWLQSKGF